MVIRSFTPAATVAMNLQQDDIGWPVTDLASGLTGVPLQERAKTVLRDLVTVHDELESADGRWFMRRIFPYRNDQGRVDGVIVTLTDITVTKRTAAAALAEKEELAASLEQRVVKRTKELNELAGALSMAEDRERQSIAADLHDDLAQLLALITLKLTALAQRSQLPAASFEEISALVVKADKHIRTLATRLSSPVLRQLGLIPALHALSDEMHRDYGLMFELYDDGIEKRLEPPVSIIVFRAIRELLINVAKHGGTLQSKVHCSVDCHAEGKTLVVVVADHGRGFAPADIDAGDKSGKGLGLPLIQQRIRLIGGEFDIVSHPGDGVEATIMVPLSVTGTGEEGMA
jgi:signal transduction histidine kinase